MDITERNDSFEKSDKYFKQLQESYTNKLLNKTEVLKESKDAFSVGKQLKAKQKIKEEEVPPIPEENKEIENTDEVPPPAVDVSAPEGEVPPVEPVETAPEAEMPPVEADAASVEEAKPLEPNPEKALKTQEFAQATIAKGLADIGTFSPETDILPSGIMKKEVQDPQMGAFTILVFPSEFKAGDVVATAFPVMSPAQMATATDEVSNETQPEEPVSEQPPVETAPEAEMPPVEEPTASENAEDEEVKLEESRDPTYVGKKDWKKMLQKILNESVKPEVIKENEDKHLEQLEAELKVAKEKNDVEEVKELEAEIKKYKEEKVSKVAKEKAKEVVKKGQKGLSDEEKEKIKQTEEN